MVWLSNCLRIGRAAGLPSVWSNCLAGWWLGGAGSTRELPVLICGATLLYVAASLLNDAFDEPFDRQYCRFKPIPSGLISSAGAWRWGWICLAAAVAAFFWCGFRTGILSLGCVGFLLLFNLTHRAFSGAGIFLGLCRFPLYLAAASVADHGVTGWAMWGGLALALYVAGAWWLETALTSEGPLRYWPIILLLAPPLSSLIVNAGPYREPALLLCAVFCLWLTLCLRHTWWTETPDLDLTTPGLQAGIVLVDWLAVADAPRALSAVFIALFLLSLGLQKLPLAPSAASSHVTS